MSVGLTLNLTYYPWITQNLDPPSIDQAINNFARAVEASFQSQTGEPLRIVVQAPMNVRDQITDICAAPAPGTLGKIALMNPLGYAAAHQTTPTVTAVAVARRKIGAGPAGPTYRAQIYVNVLTGLKTLADLKKRNFAFGSSQSTSNFLIPAKVLWDAGVHPLNSFTTFQFAGGHDTAAKAVYECRADAGAGHDGVIIDLAAKPGYENAQQRLIRIAWSPDIPSDPVVTNIPDAGITGATQKALLGAADPANPTAVANVAMAKFWSTQEGLEAIQPDAYQGLLVAAQQLGLRGTDLF